MSNVFQLKKQEALSIHIGWKLSKLTEGNWYPCQEDKKSPNKMSLKKSTLRYIAIEMSKVKSRQGILKATEEKWLMCNETPLRLSVDFLAEALQARRDWDDIFKVLREGKKSWLNILHTAKLQKWKRDFWFLVLHVRRLDVAIPSWQQETAEQT